MVVHGTHNGMKSVVENLNTKDFPRIRIGIGMPKDKNEIINYVLQKFKKEEIIKLEETISKAAEATSEIIENGIDISMNKYN